MEKPVIVTVEPMFYFNSVRTFTTILTTVLCHQIGVLASTAARLELPFLTFDIDNCRWLDVETPVFTGECDASVKTFMDDESLTALCTDVTTVYVTPDSFWFYALDEDGMPMTTQVIPLDVIHDHKPYANDQVINKLTALREDSQALNVQWAENEAVDWSEAEGLVRMLKALGGYEVHKIQPVSQILNYTLKHDEWDSGEVANWPSMLVESIDLFLGGHQAA